MEVDIQVNKKVTDKNYDLVFKLTAGVFKGRILEFLGIKSAKIEGSFPTELPMIEANTRHTDFIFLLKDGTLLHLEFQSDFTKDTLFRIFMYDARIANKYRKPVKTVIVYSGLEEGIENIIELGSVKYETEIIYLKRDYNGDEIYKKEIDKINLGKTPDWLNLIFLPIMKSTEKEVERAKAVIRALKKINLKRSHYEALVSAILVLVDKFFEEKDLYDLWEEMSMLKVIEFAEKKGIEKGIEKANIETAKKMLAEGIETMTIEKFTVLSSEAIETLKQKM